MCILDDISKSHLVDIWALASDLRAKKSPKILITTNI